MARFAGSRAPQIGIASGLGRSEMGPIKPMSFDPGTSNAGAAASAVSTGAIFGELRAKSPKYDEIANTAATIRANEQITGMKAEANMAQAGIQAAANVEAAKETAKGIEAEAAATEKAGMMSAIGGIASAGIGLISDETTKQNIQSIDDALATLRQLKPVTFQYKEEFSAISAELRQYKEEFSSSPERVHHGFIAQEFQKVLPDATYFDESKQKYCIDITDVIGLLVRANQQLESRIARLEAKQALAAV